MVTWIGAIGLITIGVAIGFPLGALFELKKMRADLEDTGSLDLGGVLVRKHRGNERRTDRYQKVDWNRGSK